MTQPLGTPQTIPLQDLHTHHNNPRRGDVHAIANSLRTNGQFRPIVVNKGTHTGRSNEVLAGNHTLMAARDLLEQGMEEYNSLDCYVVDVDEDTATRIVLADNRTADLDSYDDEGLLTLLGSLDDLEGTGYSEDDMAILKDINDGPGSLDDLADEFGEPEDDDFWVTVRLRVPPVVSNQWNDWAKAYDSPEEAFEALLDKGSDYGQA